MKSNPRKCSWCGAQVDGFCPACTKSIKQRPDPNAMTGEERRAEAEALRICEVPFPLIHERLEALAGRPIWTHELGRNFKGILEEIEGLRDAPSMKAIMDLIPPDKQVMIVSPHPPNPHNP